MKACPSSSAPSLAVPHIPGLPFFQNEKHNVANLDINQLEWKPTYTGATVLSWSDTVSKTGAANLVVIGQMLTENLGLPLSNYGYDASYRVSLSLDDKSTVAMRLILENGPFKDEPELLVRYPLSGQSATFSTKLKSLQKKEAPGLREKDPFPYVYDGRCMSREHETSLWHPSIKGRLTSIRLGHRLRHQYSPTLLRPFSHKPQHPISNKPQGFPTTAGYRAPRIFGSPASPGQRSRPRLRSSLLYQRRWYFIC
jgi:hypothetical protein